MYSPCLLPSSHVPDVYRHVCVLPFVLDSFTAFRIWKLCLTMSVVRYSEFARLFSFVEYVLVHWKEDTHSVVPAKYILSETCEKNTMVQVKLQDGHVYEAQILHSGESAGMIFVMWNTAPVGSPLLPEQPI